MTFSNDELSKSIDVEEYTVLGRGDWTYQYQEGSTRSYRFEVLDETGRTLLASKTQDITYHDKYQVHGNYINKGVQDLVYFNSQGQFASSLPSGKYFDLTTNVGCVVTDEGYSKNNSLLFDIDTLFIYNEVCGTRDELGNSYIQRLGTKIYATVCFTQREYDDGYQYIQILADKKNTFDGDDPDGKVNDPEKSLYKACFELYKGSPAYTDEGKQFFPHRYDYVNRAKETEANVSHSSFFLNEGYLWQQKFKEGYRADNSGSLLLDHSTKQLIVRFDAAGSGSDRWSLQDFFVRLAVSDEIAPALLSNGMYVTTDGSHFRSSPQTITLSFDEIVKVTGTPTITTTWGTFTYEAGDGSNILSFNRNNDATPGTVLSVTGLNGTVTDLAGNDFIWTGTLDMGTKVGSLNSLGDYFAQNSDGNYLIRTKDDLYLLAQLVNDGTNVSGKTFCQTANITCDDTYTPIGTDTNPFMGIYDGNDHIISGITINAPSSNRLGIFGVISGTSSPTQKS
ncbi:MAG: hypothetical protein J5867_09855 [Prevotella sp.]|nr:hypothetical protein [Prevotella sp.]